MPRPRFSHYVVTRAGIPCVLTTCASIAPDGVLLPDSNQQPTQFLCVRDNGNPSESRFATIYARRRAMRAIERTAKLCRLITRSIIDEHPFAKRVCDAKGDWKIKPVICQQDLQPASK